MLKKTVIYTVDGVERGFKFGMLATHYFCEEEKVNLKTMEERMNNPEPRTVINFALAAAKAYNESKKLPIDFTYVDVANWLDEIGVDKFFSDMYESLKVYQDPAEKKEEAKNLKAPIHAGQNGQ